MMFAVNLIVIGLWALQLIESGTSGTAISSTSLLTAQLASSIASKSQNEHSFVASMEKGELPIGKQLESQVSPVSQTNKLGRAVMTTSNREPFAGSAGGRFSVGSGGGGSNFDEPISDSDCYESLLDRFNKWLEQYRRLQQRIGGNSMRDAVDLVRSEFQNVGSLLVADECPPEVQTVTIGEAKDSLVNKVDYVYKSLKRLVQQLESINENFVQLLLEPIEPGEPTKPGESIGLPKQLDTAYAKRLMERTKRHIMELAKKGALDFAQVSTINFLAATGYGQQSQFSPVLDSLAPVVDMLGNVDNRLMVDYLMNLDLRKALSAINSFNPMAFLRCRAQQDDENKC